MPEMRPLRLGVRGDKMERLPNGEIILSNPQPLEPYARSYTQRLEHWANESPDRTFLAERAPEGGWRTISYGEMFRLVRRAAQTLLDHGLSAERTLMILSENEIEHAVMALAAMHVGIPYSPISINYSLVSKDFAKLRHCFNLTTPGMIYASDAGRFAAAINAVAQSELPVAYRTNPIPGRNMVHFDQIVGVEPTAQVDEAAAAVNGDTPARILFTSGSTAMPKGAINTHRVICANQKITSQVWPFILDTPPVICDWLPWNHTFGAGQIFGLVLWSGGTIHIDKGRPIPGEIETSIRNLNEVRPTIFVNVPKGFELVLPYLEEDKEFRRNFFSRLDMLFYSAASLSPAVTEAYRRLAVETTGKRVYTTTGYGSTETGPMAFMCNWDSERPGVVGLPVPSVRARLIPNGSKLEVRLKSESIVPGYWRQPELSAAAFDEDGWYKIGDALRFSDPGDHREGMVFDGRVAEDFKLKTGTWVSVGPLHIAASDAMSALAKNVLICGIDQDEVGMIVFPEIEICRRKAGLPEGLSTEEIIAAPALRALFQEKLDFLFAQGTGSSSRIARLVIVKTPLMDVEITDKNTLSRNVVLEKRQAEIDDMYSADPSIWVFLAGALRKSPEAATAPKEQACS